MSFVSFFRVLQAHWKWIAGIMAAGLLIALAVIQFSTPRYVAASRLMLEIVKPDPVTGQMMQSQFARAFVKTQTELIKDYRVAGEVVDKLGWLESPKWAEDYQNRSGQSTIEFRRWLAQSIMDNVDAKLVEGSNIMEISFTSTNPETAAKVADVVREAYIDYSVAYKRELAARNASWFKDQTEKIRLELAAVEKKKAEFERTNNIVLTDGINDTDVDRLRAIGAAAPAIATPQMIGGSGGGVPVINPASSPQVVQLDAAIANALKTLGPNHPDIAAMREQRDAAYKAAAAAASAARAAAPTAPRVAAGPSISAMYEQQQAKVLANREKADEARRLAADVAVLRDQYNRSAMRTNDLEQEAQSSEAGLTRLGNAVAPTTPDWPKKPLIMAAGLFGGLALGLLGAVLFEFFRRRVRGQEDLEMIGLPMVGALSPA